MTAHENVKRRAKSRTRVLMMATVISPTGSHQVLVRDVSGNGAQIYADKAIVEGQDACFTKGPIFVAARIAWRRNGVVGLEFYRKLTVSERQSAFHAVAFAEGEGGESPIA